MRRNNGFAALLIAPLFLLTAAAFLAPLAFTLFTAVSDRELRDTLPRTAGLLAEWNGEGLPDEAVYESAVREIAAAAGERRLGALSQRLNFEQPGFRALLTRTARESGDIHGPVKAALIALDPRWGDADHWRILKKSAGPLTPLYLLRAVDFTQTPEGRIAALPDDETLFLRIFARTLSVSLLVTALTLLAALPLGLTLARLPPRWAGLGLILVLIPFWTSVLVRTTAWFALLQKEGPVNAALLALRLADQPLQLAGTRFAVVIAMVHVLLPFAVLPVFAQAKRLDPALDRAAASLGAAPLARFRRVTLPLVMPGILAGAFMVFLLAMGFYITPALLGGPRDQLAASFIAQFISQGVNWGMASALSVLLLALTGAVAFAARAFAPGLRWQVMKS